MQQFYLLFRAFLAAITTLFGTYVYLIAVCFSLLANGTDAVALGTVTFRAVVPCAGLRVWTVGAILTYTGRGVTVLLRAIGLCAVLPGAVAAVLLRTVLLRAVSAVLLRAVLTKRADGDSVAFQLIAIKLLYFFSHFNLLGLYGGGFLCRGVEERLLRHHQRNGCQSGGHKHHEFFHIVLNFCG